jgi:selenide,water dikinase
VEFVENISDSERMLLFDAQTSGGLLLAVPQEKIERFLARAKDINQPVWEIGEVVDGGGLVVKK